MIHVYLRAIFNTLFPVPRYFESITLDGDAIQPGWRCHPDWTEAAWNAEVICPQRYLASEILMVFITTI